MYYCKDNNVNYYKKAKKTEFGVSQQYKDINFWNILMDTISHILSTFFLALFLIFGYLYITKQEHIISNQIQYILSENYEFYTTHYPLYMVKSQKAFLKKEEIARIDKILIDNNKRSLFKKALIKKRICLKGAYGRIIVVKKGDTLYTLAEKAYGNASYYRLIFDANPNVLKSKKDLYIGQVLSIPF